MLYIGYNLNTTYMKKLLIVLLFFGIGVSIASSQNLNLNYSNVPLINVLKEIQDKTQFKFVYNNSFIDENIIVSINVKNENISNVLSKLFEGTKISFKIIDKQISLSPSEFKNVKTQVKIADNYIIKGQVTSEDGEPLPAVNIIFWKNNKVISGAYTDNAGNYIHQISDLPSKIEYRFIGFTNLII